MKKTLISGFVFVSAIFCSLATAQEGDCNFLSRKQECRCDVGQTLGSCLNKLNTLSNAQTFFPTSWRLTQPGLFSGWELHMNPAGNEIALAYMGQTQAIYPVTMHSAVRASHYRYGPGHEYLVTGEASFYLDQLPFTLRYIAIPQAHLSTPAIWHKVLCVGDLCFAAN